MHLEPRQKRDPLDWAITVPVSFLSSGASESSVPGLGRMRLEKNEDLRDSGLNEFWQVDDGEP